MRDWPFLVARLRCGRKVDGGMRDPAHGVSGRREVLKLINNSLSLNKGNHARDGVWISDLYQHRF